MNAGEIEDMIIRSLDQPLKDGEKENLAKALQANPVLARDLSHHKGIRELLLRKETATFGPYFAQKVFTRIQSLRIEIDKQIVFFFRKYQLAAIGLIIALLAVNVIFSEQLDVPSVLGIQEDAVSTDDEIVEFNFQDFLTNNN